MSSTRLKPAEASQLYRFKDITTVPNAKDLIDQSLSKTQRKTPTVVHPQYAIGRIRSFYMRKVKFCQQTFHDKFASILQEFPRLDDIHPFYADLCNVLYDRDHYKLALGQVNAVRGVIDSIAKDYVRLLKYADSPYKCKMLKRAAMGRMCTTVKKLQKSLEYLEQVRQHLSRLPGINPFAKTLLLAGHPNVGKSTFMNQLSNANVEVQAFPFTTKSPYVGHFDYNYTKWQLVDTPGVLDRPLTSRNTIELTAITALAHLSCSILFLIDISESCFYSIEDQVKLFHALKPLLAHKPVVVVLNKVDLRTPDQLTDEEQSLIRSMTEGVDCIKFVTASTLLGTGVDDAKNAACDLLLAVREQKKILTDKFMGKEDTFYTADVTPDADRPAFCPPGYVPRKDEDAGDMAESRTLEKDLMEMEGGPGVFIADDRKYWDLINDGWKYDILPEFYDGKNVADYVDPDIDAKIRALEEEEAQLDATWDSERDAPSNEWYAHQAKMLELFYEQEKGRLRSAHGKSSNHRILPRRGMSVQEIKAALDTLGIDSSGVVASMKEPQRIGFLTEEDATALLSTDEEEEAPEMVEEQDQTARANMLARRKMRLLSLARRGDEVGALAKRKFVPQRRGVISNPEIAKEAEAKKVKADKRFRKAIKGMPRKDQVNEGDKFVGTAKPKHLYSGKRGIGKTDRR